jgi:hypothetical protein
MPGSIHVPACFPILTTMIGAQGVAIVTGSLLVPLCGVLVSIDLTCRFGFICSQRVTVGHCSMRAGKIVRGPGIVPLSPAAYRSKHGSNSAGVDAGTDASIIVEHFTDQAADSSFC